MATTVNSSGLADQPSTFEVRSPVDGRVLARARETPAEDVAREAARLRAAQEEWETIGPQGRARHLLRWRDWVLDNEPHLLDTIQRESGKVRQDAAFETAAGA